MAIGALSELVAVDHPRFRLVESGIFVDRVVTECLGYTCREHVAGAAEPQVRLDACCQHGADVDVGERDQILARAAAIAAVLRPEAAAAPWFAPEVEADPDFPSGARTRTTRLGDGCVFLAHDRRGCAIHRAALEGGWDLHGVKPMICRLWPLTWDEDSLGLADDYVDYTCTAEASAPTVYRGARAALAALFGAALVDALDAVEATVLARGPRRLPVVR